jgi:uncharacterized protein YcfL
MKKYTALLLILILCLMLVGCNPSKVFEIADVEKVVLMSGTTGEKVEITDTAIIQQITENINSVEFKKGQSSKNSSGWSYNIKWYDAKGLEIENITISGNGTVNYDDYFWSATNGSVDTAFLDELLNTSEGGASAVEPVGGEIFTPDFTAGVKIYIEETYSKSMDGHDMLVETPHSVWLVSDEGIIEEILSLCGEITQYRQFEIVSDIMYGNTTVYEYLPRIYLVTDTVCYSIEILNWENYSGDEWSYWPIRQELFGEPVLHVFRIDLSLMPESETAYSFVRNFFTRDSVNSEGGAGWYSTMPQQSMNELINLLGNIGADNSEEIEGAINE